VHLVTAVHPTASAIEVNRRYRKTPQKDKETHIDHATRIAQVCQTQNADVMRRVRS
jgi:hypothetical protein